MENNEGIVYILTNKAMPKYIKIGYTDNKDIKKRLKDLYKTGVPFPFELYYAIKVANAKQIENGIHNVFSIHRENDKREFFRMDPERAKFALDLAKGKEITIDDSELYDKEDEEDIIKARKSIAPPFRFSMVDIGIGEELIFSRDQDIKCTVSSDKKVKYNDEEYSLTALVKKLLNPPTAINGTRFWLYKDKLLTELRTEKELIDCEEE